MVLDDAVLVAADLPEGGRPVQVVGADQQRRAEPVAAPLDDAVEQVGSWAAAPCHDEPRTGCRTPAARPRRRRPGRGSSRGCVPGSRATARGRGPSGRRRRSRARGRPASVVVAVLGARAERAAAAGSTPGLPLRLKCRTPSLGAARRTRGRRPRRAATRRARRRGGCAASPGASPSPVPAVPCPARWWSAPPRAVRGGGAIGIGSRARPAWKLIVHVRSAATSCRATITSSPVVVATAKTGFEPSHGRCDGASR